MRSSANGPIPSTGPSPKGIDDRQGAADARVGERRPGGELFAGTRIFIAEDEVIVAIDIGDGMEEAGAAVVGPAYTLTQAMVLAAHADITAAVLDMRLGRDSIGPVARLLAERGIPFVFYSGQTNTDPLRAEWPAAPLIAKPASTRQLVRKLRDLLPK